MQANLQINFFSFFSSCRNHQTFLIRLATFKITQILSPERASERKGMSTVEQFIWVNLYSLDLSCKHIPYFILRFRNFIFFQLQFQLYFLLQESKDQSQTLFPSSRRSFFSKFNYIKQNTGGCQYLKIVNFQSHRVLNNVPP